MQELTTITDTSAIKYPGQVTHVQCPVCYSEDIISAGSFVFKSQKGSSLVMYKCNNGHSFKIHTITNQNANIILYLNCDDYMSQDAFKKIVEIVHNEDTI